MPYRALLFPSPIGLRTSSNFRRQIDRVRHIAVAWCAAARAHSSRWKCSILVHGVHHGVHHQFAPLPQRAPAATVGCILHSLMSSRLQRLLESHLSTRLEIIPTVRFLESYSDVSALAVHFLCCLQETPRRMRDGRLELGGRATCAEVRASRALVMRASVREESSIRVTTPSSSSSCRVAASRHGRP